MNKVQHLLVFQQDNSAESKIKGIKKYGQGKFEIETVSINSPLPPIIDDSSQYFPKKLEANVVLDFLKHPDLSHDLAKICQNKGIPDIASGKKLRLQGVYTPFTCCGLSRQVSLGKYSERFGSPELKVKVANNKIEEIKVIRGAPCGATWEAAKRLEGIETEQALVKIGLDTQFFCTANPAGWDPIGGKSPVHFAGEIHSLALKKAIENAS